MSFAKSGCSDQQSEHAVRVRRQSPWLFLVVGVFSPLLFALYYVRRFGVNVPENDDWFFIPTLEAFYGGGSWFPLVLQHYTEHRIIIPKLLILWFSQLTHFNAKSEMYFSVLLMGVCAFLIWRLIQLTAVPSWLIIPSGFLLLSPAQAENMLNGWQFCIPLANTFCLGMVLLLAKRPVSWARWIGAAACAMGATFSFAHGTLAWPIGLFLLIDRATMRKGHIFIWIGTSALIGVFYRWGYRGARDVPADYLSFWQHPAATAKLFLAVLGSNFGGFQVQTSIAVGLVMLALVIIIVSLERRFFYPQLRPWYALLLFSLLASALVSIGRSFAWEAFAQGTRYATLSVFVPICCLVIAGLWFRRREPSSGRAYIASYAAILLIASLLAVRTVRRSWQLGQVVLQDRLIARACLLDYREASSNCLQRMFVYSGELVRREAVVLEKYCLGPFYRRCRSAAPPK